MIARRTACLAAVLASLVAAGPAAADSHDWLRYGRDDQLTNEAPAFLARRLLPATVPALEPVWTTQLDGGIVASPLYVRNVQVGSKTEDVIFAATGGGSVYALRRSRGTVLWQRRLGTVQVCGNDSEPTTYGISATPVIDRASQTMYVIGASGELHALDLATGAERGGWPLALLAHREAEHVWGGLTLSRGRVYVPVASYCDKSDPDGNFADGRLIAVDAAQPRVAATFDVVPGPGNLGGIWGYGGTSVDPRDGSIWTATGNSWVFDPECGCIREGIGYAESIVKLGPDLVVLASHRPEELPSPIVEDSDFGSTPLLFQPQGCPPLAAAHAKNGMLYVWDRDSIETGPIWQIRIGPDDLATPFLAEPSWSEGEQTLVLAEARIYGPEGVVQFDAAVAFRVDAGCRFPSDPTWIASAGLGPKPAPLVVGDIAFVPGGRATALYALDVRDGSLLWTGGLDGRSFSSPILADGQVVVGDRSGRLHAFDVNGGCPDASLRAFGGRPSCSE